MMDEELIRIWQSSPNQERIKFEKSRLMIEIQSSIDEFHKVIRNRDLRELIAALIVIPVFGFAAFTFPQLLTRLASVLIMVYAVFVIFWMRRAKKKKPGTFSESYLEYLHQTRDYLMVQKRLLNSVLYWYILPGATLTMLFSMGFGISADRIGPILKMAIGNVVLGVAVYYLNKLAVKKDIEPRLERVDELIGVLEKPEGGK